MKKAILASVGTTVATLVVMTGSALAWTYGLTGSGQCQTDGSFKITWVVDNTHEQQALKITGSSNTAVVPVGTSVPANSTEPFTQSADGTKAGSFTLTLMGNFPGDQSILSRTATVNLAAACNQPVVIPPTTTITTPATPTATASTAAPVATPVVTKPVGSVNAGSGDPKSVDLIAILGLTGSVILTGFGLRRAVRKSL